MTARLAKPVQVALLVMVFAVCLVAFTIVVRNVMRENTVGMDFSIYWMAGRAVIFEGENPYSDEMALQNQLRVLRRPSRPDEDQMAFAYPPFSLLAPLPTFWLDFDWAQAGWMVFNILALVTALLLAFPRGGIKGVPFVLALFPFSFGILLGNFVILMDAILLLAIGLVVFGKEQTTPVQALLGLALAWVCAKPQFVWLYLLLILVAALQKKQWTLIISFIFSAFLMLGSSFLLVPDWVRLWLERMSKYTQYVGSYPMATLLLKAFLPLSIAYAITAGLFAVALGITAVSFRRWWQGRLDPLHLLAWVGFATYIIHPRNVSYAQTAFLLPLVVWVVRQSSWRAPSFWLFGVGSLVISWVVFFIQSANQENILLDEWRLFFHVFWLGWLLLSKPRPAPAGEGIIYAQ